MRDFDLKPITIHSKLSLNTYRRFYKFLAFKGYPLNNWACFIGLPLLALLCWLLLPANEFSLKPFVIMFMFFLLVDYLILLFKLWFYPRYDYKNCPAMFQTSICYQFRNHQVMVSCNDNLTQGEGEVSYQAIYHVYERSNVFYILISPEYGYLIEKSEFDGDTAQTLRQLLQSALPPKKYCICG